MAPVSCKGNLGSMLCYEAEAVPRRSWKIVGDPGEQLERLTWGGRLKELAKRWLRSNMITTHKYPKGVNSKQGEAKTLSKVSENWDEYRSSVWKMLSLNSRRESQGKTWKAPAAWVNSSMAWRCNCCDDPTRFSICYSYPGFLNSAYYSWCTKFKLLSVILIGNLLFHPQRWLLTHYNNSSKAHQFWVALHNLALAISVLGSPRSRLCQFSWPLLLNHSLARHSG